MWKIQNPTVTVTGIARMNGMKTRDKYPNLLRKDPNQRFPEPVGNLAETTSRVRGLCDRGKTFGDEWGRQLFSSSRRRFFGGLSKLFLSVVVCHERRETVEELEGIDLGGWGVEGAGFFLE